MKIKGIEKGLRGMVVHGGEQQEISHHVQKNAIESREWGPQWRGLFFSFLI